MTISAIINTLNKSQIIPVSIFDGDELILKTNINPEITNVANQLTKQVNIIKINDNAILFDNQFYFSLSEPSNIKVLSMIISECIKSCVILMNTKFDDKKSIQI